MHGDSLLLPSVSCRAATAAFAGARWALRLGFTPGCRDVAGKRSEQRPGIFAILVDLLLGAASLNRTVPPARLPSTATADTTAESSAAQRACG